MSPGVLSSLSSIQRRIPSSVLIACFGLILTAAAWFDVLHRQSADREAEIERIYRENSALARAFEEHVRRVVQTGDNALLFLQYQYEANGRVTEEIVSFIERTKSDPILNQISLADSRGDLRLSALPLDKPINISQREHFQVHAASADRRTAHRQTRPDADLGHLVAVPDPALEPARRLLRRHCRSRSRSRPISPTTTTPLRSARTGASYWWGGTASFGLVASKNSRVSAKISADSPMFRRIDLEPTGHYEVTGSIDSLRRFVSYRALPDFPLIVAVSSLTSTALAPYRHRAAGYRLSAMVFTLFVAIFCLVLIRAEQRTRRQNSSLSAELTERRKAEEALHESQELFAAFLDHIPAVVFVQDLQGRTLYSNQAFKDLPEREAIGRNARELLFSGQDGPPGNRPALRGRIVVLDEAIPERGGRARVFETRMFIVDRAGKEPLLGCVSVDSTGRRQAEEERLVFERRMQQAQKLESLGVLAGGIAHDFNNLLMVILGNADLALSKSAAESPVIGFIRNIDAAAQRAADLANQMLAYSGKGRFLIEPINLSRLVEEMGHLLASVISKRATMRYRLAGELPPVQADATQLRQVVMNLITNASDAIGNREGAIEIATGVVEIGPRGSVAGSSGPALPLGTYVFLEVSDTGEGMDQATQNLIFDPFYSTKQTGRGLGLASVLGIVRGHNGEIRVTSKPGQGTTFMMLLPVAPDNPPARTVAAGRPTPAVSPAVVRRTILLVDDEDQVLQTTRTMLEESGFTVLTAIDGVEGVAVFRSQAAHLSAVVLDMNMPRMDGAEAFRQMRRIAPGVPVILTSGFDEQDAVSEFTAAGLAGFIQKPYRMRALLQKIEDAIAPGPTSGV